MNYFSFTRSEARKSVIILVLLLISIVFRAFISKNVTIGLSENIELLSDVIKAIESMEIAANKYEVNDDTKETDLSTTFNPVYFDPNTADSMVLSRTGLNRSSVNNLIRYREAGGVFYKKTDLLKIYGVTGSDYERISDYIVLNETENFRDNKESFISEKEGLKELKICINTADTSRLKELKGIGGVLSSRIVKYRNIIGGYASADQLLEVYGIDSVLWNNILPLLEFDKDKVQKININLADEEKMSGHPYFSRILARDIIKYRELAGKIESMEELRSSGIINEEDYGRIVPYIELK